MLSPDGAIGTAALPIPSSLNVNNIICPPPPSLPHMMCFPPPTILKKFAPLPLPQIHHLPIGILPDFSQPPPPILKQKDGAKLDCAV